MGHTQCQKKICGICGDDCADRPRTKDTAGRYYCTSCYERAREEKTQGAGVIDPAGFASEMLVESLDVRRCRACRHPLESSAILCTNCGFDLRTQSRHVSRVESVRPEMSGESTNAKWDRIIEAQRAATARRARWDLVIPLLLVGIGLAVTLSYVAAAANLYFIGFGFEITVGLVCLWIAAKLWLNGAGSPLLAVLRLAGIYLFVDAIGFVLAPTLALAVGVQVVAYLGLLAWLFDLDPWDAIMLAFLTFLSKWAVGVTVGFILVAMSAS